MQRGGWRGESRLEEGEAGEGNGAESRGVVGAEEEAGHDREEVDDQEEQRHDVRDACHARQEARQHP